MIATLLLLSLATAVPQRAQLEALVSQGRLDEAEQGYRTWAAAEPSSVEALLGLCRILRWTGRLIESRTLASRAVDLSPSRADAREELARTYANEELPAEAERALPDAAPDDLRLQLDRLNRVAVNLSSAASSDSNGVSRVGPRLSIEMRLPRDLRLTVGTGVSHLVQGGAALDHRLAGAALELPFERVALLAGYVLHQGTGTVAQEVEGAVKVRPADAVAFGISFRHRPLIEAADSLATDESAFYSAGAGGAFHPRSVQWLAVDEAKSSLAVTPLRSLFIYGAGSLFKVGDGNRGWSAAAGAGLELVRLFGGHAPVETYLRWDGYFTGFASREVDYFSPAFQDGQGAGLDLRLHLAGRLTLGAEGGRTFALFSTPQAGWFGGAHLELQAGRFALALHAQVRDDPWYGTQRAWLQIRSGF